MSSAAGVGNGVEPAPPVNADVVSNRIELGWIVSGRLDRVDREAVDLARSRMLSELRTEFPEFDWHLPRVRRTAVAPASREESVDLLELGIRERHVRRWDFAVVVVGVDLIPHYGSQALATPSQSVGVAVLSTSRIDPLDAGEELSVEDRTRLLGRRLHALAMHLFGRLNGVEYGESGGDWMRSIDAVADLDAMERYSDSARAELVDSLRDVADLRLEETPTRRSRPLFYLKASWLNLSEIASAVRKARPWLFPFRLSRFSAAAFSVLLLLLGTAEAWELGMSQTAARVVLFTTAVFFSTTVYIINRQRLLVRPGSRASTEQMVITNVATTLCVVLGLVTTYLVLVAVIFALAFSVYPTALVTSWAPSIAEPLALAHYARLAAFVASLGILIGSLGASFEGYQYFRHVIFIDEEV